MRDLRKLDLAAAQRLIKLGIKQAEAMHSPSNIAVVDATGTLLAHKRMSDAQVLNMEQSILKAKASVKYKRPTIDLHQEKGSVAVFDDLKVALSSRDGIVAGGMPILNGDLLLGAIGISGGSAYQDQHVAQAIIDAFLRGLVS